MTATAFAASSVHEFTLNALNGTPTPLANYKGKVMLIVSDAGAKVRRQARAPAPHGRACSTIHDHQRGTHIIPTGAPSRRTRAC